MADSHSTTGALVKGSPDATPSLYIAKTVVAALVSAFPRPKHRARLIRALAHATARLAAEGHVVRVREREPVAFAMARSDAGLVLQAALDELETQLLIANHGGGVPNPVSFAATKVGL